MGYWEEINDPAFPRRWIWVDDPPVNPVDPGKAATLDPSIFNGFNAIEPAWVGPLTTGKAPGNKPGDKVTIIQYNNKTGMIDKVTLPYDDPRLTGAAGEDKGELRLDDNGNPMEDPAGDLFDPNWEDPNKEKVLAPHFEMPSFEMPSFEMPSFTIPEWPKPQLPAYPTAPTPGTSAVQAKTSLVDRSRIRKLTLLSDQNKSVAAAKLGHTSTGQTAGKRRLLG